MYTMGYPFDSITDFIFVPEELPGAPCDAILIPGGSRPELMKKAAELYKNGKGRYIIVSGAYNFKIPAYKTEAEYLKSIALNEGIPQEAIICEEKATNTYENALFSLEKAKEHKLNVDNVILICKTFHSRRALFTYQKVFPQQSRFYVQCITDERYILADNWYKNVESIKLVMGEVEKMEKYFQSDIYELYKKGNN